MRINVVILEVMLVSKFDAGFQKKEWYFDKKSQTLIRDMIPMTRAND